MDREQNEEAERDFNRVLARDSHHAGALTGLGILAFRARRFSDARRCLEEAINGAPSYQKAHYYYALTLSRLGSKPEAAREFALAKELQKPHLAPLP